MARVHVTYTDDEMLSVTKHSFQHFISGIQHMQLHSFHATFLAEILAAAFIFNEDLACELEIRFLGNVRCIENDRGSIHQAVE